MKMLPKLFLSFGAICLLISACSTTPNAKDTPKTSPSPSAKPKQITLSVAKVTREETRYADGVLASAAQYQYDAKGNLLVEIQLNGKGGILSKKTAVFSSDFKTATISNQNANGDVQGITLREYDGNGQMIRESITNANKDIESISEYSYDAKGNMLSWVTKGANQSVIARITYTVKNGMTSRIEISDAGDQIIKRFDQTFTPSGKIASKTEKDSSGKILSRINYSYSNDLLSKEEYLNGDGGLQRSIAYVYNDKGQAIKAEFFDRKGQLMETRNQEFQVFTRTVTISE